MKIECLILSKIGIGMLIFYRQDFILTRMRINGMPDLKQEWGRHA